MPNKPISYSPAALKAFKGLPEDIQLQFTLDLNAIAQDERPYSDFKDISGSVGKGAIELIENGSPAFRVVYCVKYLGTVFVLHAFTKTTNGVDKPAMDTAAKRYKDMMEEVNRVKREQKKLNKSSKKPKGNKKRRK
ncbi:MAG: type II toxin-antitoxin system RelE/ParE family toxin [Colwellia sp.]